MSTTNKEYEVKIFVVGTQKTTFYLTNGDKLVMESNDPHLPDIIKRIKPILDWGGVAKISLNVPIVYKEVEDNSKGLVKFFKGAKSLLSRLLAPPEPQTINIPLPEAPSEASTEASQTPKDQEAFLEKVLQEAEEARQKQTPSQHEEDLSNLGSDETVYAVIDGAKGKVVIPDIERVKLLIEHSAQHNNPAFAKLISRCAKIIGDNRRYTVEDLLKFLEKSDLPLTNDGCIIAYKVLHLPPNAEDKELWYDCYTKRIPQRVGSYDHVDESLVDLNRNQSCSNGLHIARRGYISGFSGEVCVLCIINPEDVMVVPHNDYNKVRVKGYHIIGKLSFDSFSRLKLNKPIDPKSSDQVLLTNAINGIHVDIMEYVRITAQMGASFEITSLEVEPKEEIKVPEEEAPVSVDSSTMALDAAVKEKAKEISPLALNTSKSFKVDPKPELTRKQFMQYLFELFTETFTGDTKDYLNIAQFIRFTKSKYKIGWDSLGITEDTLESYKKAIEESTTIEFPIEVVSEEFMHIMLAREQEQVNKPVGAVMPLNTDKSKKQTNTGYARELFNNKQYVKLIKFKADKRTSWAKLGFTEAEIDTIKAGTTPS